MAGPQFTAESHKLPGVLSPYWGARLHSNRAGRLASCTLSVRAKKIGSCAPRPSVGCTGVRKWDVGLAQTRQDPTVASVGSQWFVVVTHSCKIPRQLGLGLMWFVLEPGHPTLAVQAQRPHALATFPPVTPTFYSLLTSTCPLGPSKGRPRRVKSSPVREWGARLSPFHHEILGF